MPSASASWRGSAGVVMRTGWIRPGAPVVPCGTVSAAEPYHPLPANATSAAGEPLEHSLRDGAGS
jgi:hypothetical protein